MDDSYPSSPLRPVQADTAATPPAPKKRKNAAATPSLPKPKKQKLPRNLDSITARNQLPNVPSTGGVSKTGQRMVKGPYKKREKKDKDGKVIPASAGPSGTTAGAGAGAGAGGAGGARRGKVVGSKASSSSASAAAGSGSSLLSSSSGTGAGHGGAFGPGSSDASFSRADATGSPAMSVSGARDDADDLEGGRRVHPGGAMSTADGGEGNNNEGVEAGAEGKDEDDDDHDEEPEYSEFEWTQEANSRDRSKDELKALLDSFSQEQLRRYEVYRRAVLSRPTVKKLVGTILNQQVTQTMAFVVAGFSKVFVGEMVERAREVMEEWGDTGAIRPDHLREAQRRYKKEEQQRGRGAQPPYGYKRRLFCR